MYYDTDPGIQEEFDLLWVTAAKASHEQTTTASPADAKDAFIKEYIQQRFAGKYKLAPEEFAKLESNFKSNWHPTFHDTWQRNQ